MQKYFKMRKPIAPDIENVAPVLSKLDKKCTSLILLFN